MPNRSSSPQPPSGKGLNIFLALVVPLFFALTVAFRMATKPSNHNFNGMFFSTFTSLSEKLVVVCRGSVLVYNVLVLQPEIQYHNADHFAIL